MALIFLKYTTPPPPPKFHAGTCSHLKGFGGPAERHVSSPLSAVFAVRQARGALHLRKRVATQGNGRKGGGGALWKGQGPERREKSSHKTVSLQRDRERESKGQIDRERERGGGCWNNAPSAAGAMAKAVRV